jgi:hypothetical protein
MASVPFGGVKSSGVGRSHGVVGLMEFTRTRAVVDEVLPRIPQVHWFGYDAGLADALRALCARMDAAAFLGFVAARRKEADALRAEVPPALSCCVDPANFVMDAVADVFPVDRREMKSPADLAWACVLILEAAVPALADPDPEIGAARPLVPRAARERARGMAREWKEAVELKGGVEGAKPPDAHAFLQHVATFAVAEREDRPLYRRIVLSFSWRRQMPRLALALGLHDEMPGMRLLLMHSCCAYHILFP